MKKAFNWLDTHNVSYVFYDFKKQEAPLPLIERAITEHGWESVINKRGTTWRGLEQDIKDSTNAQNAAALAVSNPSLIKRPLLEYAGKTYIGFDAAEYARIFADI